jgi:hypothetical protein
MNNHSHLVHKVLLEIGNKYHHVRAWKSHTGEAYTMSSVDEALKRLKDGEISIWDFTKSLIRISFGKVGQTDITGIMAPHGRAIYIEVKTGTGRLSKDQKLFRDMILKHGGLHIECRKLEDLQSLNQEKLL